MAKVKEEQENRGGNRGIDNLIPFVKGQSGNPNGRPLGQRNYATIYKEALIKLGTINNKTPEELETELISSGFALAKKGDYRFYKDVLDRIHGQPVQKSETKVTGDLQITSIPQEAIDIIEADLKKKKLQ